MRNESTCSSGWGGRVTAGTLLLGYLLHAGAAAEPRKWFVTSTSGTAKLATWAEAEGSGLGGVAAGDEICQVRAQAGGLAVGNVPRFRAWISITGNDAYCHVQGLGGTQEDACQGQDAGSGPWVRTDGVPFSEVGSLTGWSGRLSPPMLTEEGDFVGGTDLVWTGTGIDGQVGDACLGWSSEVGTEQLAGQATRLVGWTSGTGLDCDEHARLYCAEEGIGEGEPLRPPNPPGAIAFLTFSSGPGVFSSWGALNPTMIPGMAGADAVCRAEAEQASLPTASSFRAWLSDSSTNAKDRFTIGGPWVRVDGVPFAWSLADLTSSAHPVSTLHVAADGTDLSLWAGSPQGYVWTGTKVDGTAQVGTCGDWMDWIGNSNFGDPFAANETWTEVQNTPNCGNLRRIYCLGDVILLFWDNFESGSSARWDEVIMEE